ncbi:hypothetical protein F0U64_07305 [Achromobacter xylosoxidans]|uniref:VENN motif pre-toxin domain-containing protein n=1 Tax=Alcaligenes xylosoxydans xylosoxydans TaxID=85698 RepID=UPI00122F13C4|nr:VENN motif pre-toxin domain-containing protein [Achromobacter xylosoxidans]QEQ22201.1 hypothetical protein F0U64_07305 [Achromobacter xylosoxidans]
MKHYGTGSDLQKAAQAVTGALTALAGDNLAGALGSAAAPYLATEIKRRIGEDNPAANAMAHAVLGAVTAQLNGQSPLAGGLGAGGGELAARVIARQLFPGKDPDALSETEKQQVSALSQLAAGIAGGLATGDAAGGVTGAQAGRNAVENNNLNAPQLDEFAERARGCGARGDCHQVIEEMERLSVAQQDRLISVCATDPNACRKEYGDIPANSMLIRDAIDRVLGDSDIPWQMKADMGPLLSQQIDAEGVVSSTEFAERLARTYGIDKERAELLSGALLGAISGGTGKNGKSTSAKNIKVPSAIPGVVRSRINLWKGDSPKRGWDHVVLVHYSGKESKSQFTISQAELRVVLQSSQVVGAPIVKSVLTKEGVRYFREVDMKRPVGTDAFNGHKSTSIITVLTDVEGNLITATPGRMK